MCCCPHSDVHRTCLIFIPHPSFLTQVLCLVSHLYFGWISLCALWPCNRSVHQYNLVLRGIVDTCAWHFPVSRTAEEIRQHKRPLLVRNLAKY
ncbi:hypothetical protein BV25DRAFT_1579003 [Artomyces pyxidatus]|uniref:Uncharacterized protein n=1 Tax=Artomyces pyxidatus TaxID=48021 RepID=A0ACB8SIR6_9AGAM|nr:hypothetical protein BV25DRAFT_1579003 [Artomyces pyxidatus]